MTPITEKTKLYHFIQIHFLNETNLRFNQYPELKELATWFAVSGKIWTCRNKNIPLDEFKKQFFAITGKTENQVIITDGGIGQGMNGVII